MSEGESSGAVRKTMFFCIPVQRLVVMSILTAGIYEIYWIYKNFKYLKQRSYADIWPFWRGIFGILFLHSLLRAIHDDFQTNEIRTAEFRPMALATGWVMLMVIGNVVGFASSTMSPLISALIQLPAVLLLVPVQQYVNSVNFTANESVRHYHTWSAGHVVCLVLGILVWYGAIVSAGGR